MPETPKISVLVPVYKTDRGVLRETISSVLGQSLRDFELILLDDCPTDPREDLAREFDDPRIKYVANDRNLGITPSRNRLIDMAKGEYLAVLDHDDVCHVDRLKKESAYLDSHPECGVVSSFTRLMPGGQLIARPITDRAIRIRLMRHCAVSHSAAMIRADVLKAAGIRYEAEFSPSEDYRLFCRLMDFTEFHCIPEPLLHYRAHAGNTTASQYDAMLRTAMAISEEASLKHPGLNEDFKRESDRTSRIVVSGGWSYGNLGMDAVLDAAGRLLWKFLPEADVFWLAYDKDAACSSGVVPADRVLPSLHRTSDRGRSFWQLQTAARTPGYAFYPPFLRRIYERFFLCRKIRNSIKRDRSEDASAVFRDADLYILNWDGCFDRLSAKFDSCIREIELAHENGSVVMLTGIGLESFSAGQKERLKAVLRPSDIICVRDSESVAGMARLGFDSVLMADLALAYPSVVSMEKHLVTVVPGFLEDGQHRLLADQLVEFVRAGCGKCRIRVVPASATWPEEKAVRDLAEGLQRRGVSCEMMLPRTYDELKSAIEGSELVISRCFCAIVMGYRAGSKVFSIAKSRRTLSFLEMTGMPGNACEEKSWSELAGLLSSVMRSNVDNMRIRPEDLSAEVHASFHGCIARSGLL